MMKSAPNRYLLLRPLVAVLLLSFLLPLPALSVERHGVNSHKNDRLRLGERNDDGGRYYYREDAGLISCPEPRPLECVQKIDPVCGKKQTGSSSRHDTEDYTNPCLACKDEEVIGYRHGKCE